MGSKGVNKVIIVGHVGQDPEIRYMPNGDAVCNFSLATSEEWKDKNGEERKETEWHRVTFFRKPAEVIEKYAKKGTQLFVEGKLKTRSWEKDGQKHYATEIVGRDFQFLGGGKTSDSPRNEAPDDFGPPPPDDFDDDIPF